VSIAARDGEQIELLAIAWPNRIPSRARRSMLGVWMNRLP
jgi:hypothetical protein